MKLITLLVFLILKLHSSSCADVNDCPGWCTCYLYTNELQMNCDSAKPILIIPTNLSVPVTSITWLYIWNGLNETFPTNICQYSQLTYLYISGSKLTNITSPTLKCLTKLQSLSLGSNGIKYIGNDSLCLNSLTSLDLWGNQINQFSLNFENCNNSKLTTLSLRYNFLTNITNSYLKWLASIQTLDLSWNTINYIASDAFSNLTNLNTLYLTNNQLTNLTDLNLEYITSLQTLDLSSNHLVYNNCAVFEKLNSLKVLYLANNQIDQQSFAMCRFTKLSYLSLSQNNFTNLTNLNFEYGKTLQYIDLSYNQIKYITCNTFGNLTSLTTLYLNYNRLTNLTNLNLQCISTIQTFYIQNNNLTYVDCDAFRNLTRLTSLYLDYNQIDQISFNECQFSQLRTLSMTSNQFTSLSNSNFKFIQTLQVLDLIYNQINFISNYTFDNLTSLSILYLSNNKISIIPKYLFTSSLTSLYYIDLSYNYLTTMELWPTYLPNARYVNLQHNQISKFTNEFGWSINNQSSQWSNSYYWSRNIDLQYNSINSFGISDLQKYGICNLTDYQNILVNVFQFFNMNNNLISCNCSNNLYDLQSLNSSYLYQTQCSKPAIFVGKSILTYDSCTNLTYFYPTNSTFCNQQLTSTLQTSTFQTSTLQTSTFQTSKHTSQFGSTHVIIQSTTQVLQNSINSTLASTQITTKASTHTSFSN